MHAHLSGSASDATLFELLEEHLSTESAHEREKFLNMMHELKAYSSASKEVDLDSCFKLFAITHKILSNLKNLARVTREVLESFSAINVVYLELRTTPRNIYSTISPSELVVSKKEYIDTVLDSIRDHEKKSSMIVRLILSVDRTKGLEDGLDTIELANSYAKAGKYVVGIDYSGNPKVTTFKNFQPCFDLARKYGLKMTIHTAEIWEDLDVDFVLKNVRPERLDFY